jgi:glycerol-3-phosphate cytidylyltransferase
MKPYKIGYIAGVFDLFHVGHLNLLRRAKDKSEHLIVGVLTDELVFHFKKKLPVIDQNDRREIIQAIRYVDQTVLVSFENIDKMKAWELYRFDCLFSGDDWKNEPVWIEDKKRLNEVGSNIEFFPYTQGISTTQLRNLLQEAGE